MADFDEYEPQQYVKLPIPITAQRMRERFTVKTLEGTLDGKAGDYLMTGISGEQYPCDAAIFAKTYRIATTGPTEPPQVDAEPITGPMCSRCGIELLSDDVECCEQAIVAKWVARLADRPGVQSDAGRCDCAGSIGGPHPTCIACNGTGRKGEQ